MGGEMHKQKKTARAARSPSPSPATSSAAKGSRLPRDWTLPPEWQAWALGQQPTWTPEHCLHVAETFRDYWIAQPGQRGVKIDWAATWRNWVRREKPMRKHMHDRQAQTRYALRAFVAGDPLETSSGLVIDGKAKRLGT